MPYKSREDQLAAMKKWRQAHLFEVADYEKNKRVRSDEYIVQKHGWRQAQYERERGTKTFIGCDGEGMGEGAEHDYYVWRMGREVLVTGEPLKSRDILEFIVAQPKGPIYTIFSGNYDFTMMLRGAPGAFIRDLLNRAGRTDSEGNVRPARWEGIRVDYIPHKRLSVGLGSNTIVIHDVFGFFQTSFVNALEEWEIGTLEERRQIAEGKERRGTTDVLSPTELAYNERECELLAEMVTKLDKVTTSLTLSASPYEGAGAIASSLMKLHVSKPIKERNKRLPDDDKEPLTFNLLDPPQELIPSWEAYYGGRFEITAHGPISQPVYEYDINSAYPAVITNLPCLLHGRWEEVKSVDPHDSAPVLGYIRWSIPSDSNFGPLPHRNRQGNVTFPARGSGWYWSIEWPEDPNTYEVVQAYRWDQICKDKPFYWVKDRYEQRKAHKQAGRKGQAMMLKLGYNSLYGKMAQNVGEAPWRNSVYAGLVTATCRRWLRDAAMQRPDDIVMFATDGIYSLSPLDLPSSNNLGEWECSVYESGLHIVRPGIYFSPDGEAKVKSRGISRAVVSRHAAQIMEAFELIRIHPEWITSAAGPKLQEDWSVPLSFNGLVSLRLAWAQNRPERAGYFGTLPHKMSYNLFPKRVPIDSTDFESNWRGGIFRSGMPPCGNPLRSVGYGKGTSAADPDAMDMVESAPDWAVPLQLEMDELW